MGAKRIVKKKSTRTKPRVEETEPKGSVRKNAAHRGSVVSGIPVDANGHPLIEITCQGSELVPVAQYASVTIGPVALKRWIVDPGLSELVGKVTTMDDYDDLSASEKKIYDQFYGEMKVGQSILEALIADDRDLVDESVRKYNERESEAGKKRKS